MGEKEYLSQKVVGWLNKIFPTRRQAQLTQQSYADPDFLSLELQGAWVVQNIGLNKI